MRPAGTLPTRSPEENRRAGRWRHLQRRSALLAVGRHRVGGAAAELAIAVAQQAAAVSGAAAAIAAAAAFGTGALPTLLRLLGSLSRLPARLLVKGLAAMLWLQRVHAVAGRQGEHCCTAPSRRPARSSR